MVAVGLAGIFENIPKQTINPVFPNSVQVYLEKNILTG